MVKLADAALPLLQRLPPERAHQLALGGLRAVHRIWPTPRMPARAGVSVAGLRFAHPVGLAAGFDKNGDYVDALGALGFSHVEIGTVTPRPQPGNAPPRLARVRVQTALVNRMGFNNKGIAHVAMRLARARFDGVRGVSIGKNADTPLERAVDDYVACLRGIHGVADYIAINVSSPNTQGLRELQGNEALAGIVGALQEERRKLEAGSGRRVPLLVKISPDFDEEGLHALCAQLRGLAIDGAIATNTTTDLARLGVEDSRGGGLSGAPLRAKSLATLQTLRRELGPDFPIIGVGGIVDAASALERLAAGATLVQLYTGFVYRGPALLNDILDAIAAHGR
jgi:dihydroorotate dehydrogenase